MHLDKVITALMRRWLPLAILLVGLGAFFYFDLSQFLNFSTLQQHRQTLLSWTKAHYFQAAFTYIIIYILAGKGLGAIFDRNTQVM